MKKDLPKKTKTPLFPRIYRFITEWWKVIVTSFVSGMLLIVIVLQSLTLYYNLQEQAKTNLERGQVEKELAQWKIKSLKYKDSRDIYFKIATLEYRLGNKTEAKSSLNRALEIDPNFEKGRELEKQLVF